MYSKCVVLALLGCVPAWQWARFRLLGRRPRTGAMKPLISRTAAPLLLLTLGSLAHAQSSSSPGAESAAKVKNEVGLVIGATLTPSVALQRGGNVDLNSSLALGVEYDRRFAGKHTAFYGGIDFIASPLDVKASAPPPDVSPEYAYFFLTPHVRAKFNADGKWQPWLLFGGGYGDFAPAQPRGSSVKVTGAGNSGALVFGGGVDTKPLVHLSLPLLGALPIGARFEVRDFLSGQPKYGVPTTSSLQNNVAFTGGFLLRF